MIPVSAPSFWRFEFPNDPWLAFVSSDSAASFSEFSPSLGTLATGSVAL